MMRRRDGKGGAGGFTLIELVVAMAIFALVAVMGLQALSGMLRQRERAADFARASADLGRAAGLIRRDLSAALPMLFYPPEGRAQSAVYGLPGDAGFALTVANTRPYAPLGAAGLALRVEYRWDAEAGRLWRREWQTAWPASAAARGPEMEVLTGVTGLRLRSYWTGIGWVEGLRFAALEEMSAGGPAADEDGERASAEVYSDLVPQAVEITLETESFGRVRLLESPL